MKDPKNFLADLEPPKYDVIERSHAERDAWQETARQFCQNADYWRDRAEAAERLLADVERALDDEEANLADDGARLSHAVVRRVRAAARGDGDRG